MAFRETLVKRFDPNLYGIHTIMKNKPSSLASFSASNDFLDPSDGYMCEESTAIVYDEANRRSQSDDSFGIRAEPWGGVDQYGLFFHAYPKLHVDGQTFILDFVPPYISKGMEAVQHHDQEVISETAMAAQVISKTTPLDVSVPFRFQTAPTGGYLSLVGFSQGITDRHQIQQKFHAPEEIRYVVSFESFYVSPDVKTFKPESTEIVPPHPYLHIEVEFTFSQLFTFAFAYQERFLFKNHGRITDDQFRIYYRELREQGIVKVAFQSQNPTKKHDFGAYGEAEAELAFGQFLDYFIKWVSYRPK